MLNATYAIPDMPPPGLEKTPAVLRALSQAHRHLAELKGRAASIPNQGILIDTLAMQEARLGATLGRKGGRLASAEVSLTSIAGPADQADTELLFRAS